MAITWLAAVEKYSIEGKRKVHRVRLTTSGSGNTYTTGGDAAPTFGQLGFKRNLDYLIFVDTSADGHEYKYDATNKKIKIFVGDNDNAGDAPSAELAAEATHNSKSILVEAVGW